MTPSLFLAWLLGNLTIQFGPSYSESSKAEDRNWGSWSDRINAVCTLGLVASAYFVYRTAKRDRQTDVIIMLEEQFNKSNVVEGRAILESDAEFGKVAPILVWYCREKQSSLSLDSTKSTARNSGQLHQRKKPLKEIPYPLSETPPKPPIDETDDLVESLDALLRFYVVLKAMHESGEVKGDVLRVNYAYWMNKYFDPNRTEFREYVFANFSCLSGWILRDADYFRSKHRDLQIKSFGSERRKRSKELWNEIWQDEEWFEEIQPKLKTQASKAGDSC